MDTRVTWHELGGRVGEKIVAGHGLEHSTALDVLAGTVRTLSPTRARTSRRAFDNNTTVPRPCPTIHDVLSIVSELAQSYCIWRDAGAQGTQRSQRARRLARHLMPECRRERREGPNPAGGPLPCALHRSPQTPMHPQTHAREESRGREVGGRRGGPQAHPCRREGGLDHRKRLPGTSRSDHAEGRSGG